MFPAKEAGWCNQRCAGAVDKPGIHSGENGGNEVNAYRNK